MTFGDIETVGELIMALNQFDPEMKVKVSKDGNHSEIWKIEEGECETWSANTYVKLII